MISTPRSERSLLATERATQDQSAPGRPLVTVIMPVRNEEAFIRRSLEAVLQQDYGLEHIEVIVADGMSTDGTRDVVRSMQAQGAKVQLIDNLGQIAPTGLNATMAAARGQIIVRVDGHCEIDRDYVRRCVERLEHEGVDGVGGPLETIGQTPLAQAIAVAMSSPFGVGGSAFRTVRDRTLLVDTIAFPAYRRSIVEQAGPYDEELVRNQDDEYNYRLRKMGARLLLAADVRARYYSRSSLGSLWRQYFQYGYWKVRVMQKHPRQMRLRQFVPAAFVAALLVALLSIPWTAAGAWLFGGLLAAYVLANLAASALASRQGNAWMLPILPLAFATLHFAYGIGFLVGLVRFCSRWGRRDGPAIGKPKGKPY